jgi:hypothetical protein
MDFTIPQLRQISDFGTSEPWVARIHLTFLDLLKFVRPGPVEEVKKLSGPEIVATTKAKQEAATGLIFALAEDLGQAFIELRRIRQPDGTMATELAQSKAYRDLYGHLWAAYKSRFQKLMGTLGYDVGFVFDKDSKFETRATEFLAQHPDIDASLVDRVRNDRAGWQKALADYRNDGEHNTTVPLFNGHPMHDQRSAEVIFSNVWHEIEDIFIACMVEEFGKQLTIFEIPKADRDPRCPKKYVVGVSHDPKTGAIISRS